MNKTRSFCISFCPLRILYNSKFIIMATSLRTMLSCVTRVHCFPLKCRNDDYCEFLTWKSLKCKLLNVFTHEMTNNFLVFQTVVMWLDLLTDQYHIPVVLHICLRHHSPVTLALRFQREQFEYAKQMKHGVIQTLIAIETVYYCFILNKGI